MRDSERERMYSFIKVGNVFVTLEEFRRRRDKRDKLLSISFVIFVSVIMLFVLGLSFKAIAVP